MKKRREPGALIFSIVVHVIVSSLILSAAFHYDFSGLDVTPTNPPRREQVAYVNVAPTGGVSRSADTTRAAAKSTVRPPEFAAPTQTPTSITPLPPLPAAQAGGVDGGTGRAREATVITGIVPSQPDPRLVTDPNAFYPLPKTHAQRVDSAVRASIVAYNDSVARALAMRGKEPGDWTYEKNGQKWGMDGSKIYLGKFAIPSAVLAALPIKIQGNPGEGLANRLAPTRRADILLHAESQAHDDDFNAAVRRIRERKDKERAERQAGSGSSAKPIP